MKHAWILTITFALAGSLSAQTEKGTWALGLHNFSPIFNAGQLAAPTNAFGFAFGKTKAEIGGQSRDVSKYSSVGLNFSGHYFFIDNLSGGVNFNLFFQKEKEEGGTDPSDFSATILLVGPELRYYLPAGAKHKIFLKGNAGFGSVKSKFTGFFDEETTDKILQFGGGAGLTLFLSQQVGLDLGLGYGIFRVKDEDDDTMTNSGVMADIGFTIFLQGGSSR